LSFMQRNLRHIWGDMMHYRLLPIRHLGGTCPPCPPRYLRHLYVCFWGLLSALATAVRNHPSCKMLKDQDIVLPVNCTSGKKRLYDGMNQRFSSKLSQFKRYSCPSRASPHDTRVPAPPPNISSPLLNHHINAFTAYFFPVFQGMTFCP